MIRTFTEFFSKPSLEYEVLITRYISINHYFIHRCKILLKTLPFKLNSSRISIGNSNFSTFLKTKKHNYFTVLFSETIVQTCLAANEQIVYPFPTAHKSTQGEMLQDSTLFIYAGSG